MKNGLHITSLYRSNLIESEQSRTRIPVAFALILLIMSAVWGIHAGREMERQEQQEILRNESN